MLWACSWEFEQTDAVAGTQLNHAKSLITTDQGLLIANTGDNAIYLESFGRPLSEPNVLTEKDGIKSPVSLDLIYDKESNEFHLWIAEYNQDGHAAIKCFKTEYD